MSNMLGLSYEPIITQLREQKALLLRALQQIDQAITSLEAISSLGLMPSLSDSPSLSPYMVHSVETSDPQNKADGYPFQLKEEVASLVESLSAEITQPRIFKSIIAKYPEVEARAKESQLGARISGELRKLEDQGILVLIKKSVSNFPNVYKKASEMTAEEIAIAKNDLKIN